MTTTTPSPIGVAKVVTLGNDKVLIVQINNDAAEGEYAIKTITANPTGPAGAGDCIIQVNN